jgi:hypothetical protein
MVTENVLSALLQKPLYVLLYNWNGVSLNIFDARLYREE